MRHFFRIAFLTLVLILVFLVSAMTAMRFAIHGRETNVPSFVGLSTADAAQQASQHGLILEYGDRFYSAEVPEGRIVSQLPAGGEKVRRGWRVRLALSLGPQRVTIPNVVGQSPRAAEINLTRRGLELGSVASVKLSGLPSAQVVAQSPAAGAEGITSPKVNLLQTAAADSAPAYYVMPNLVGRRLGEATEAMADAGFHLGHARLVSGATGARAKPIATDTIVLQSPPAGQKVGEGAAISFDLAR
jgi:beta-lactam-binding protein with PASTA domain